MRFIKSTFAGLSILAIPTLVGYPVAHTPAASAPAPREILMARLTEAALAAQSTATSGVGLGVALGGLGLLLTISVWLAFRRRPVSRPERPARACRASVALEMIQRGTTSDDVMIRAQVSRDAVQLLRHTTIGHSLN